MSSPMNEHHGQEDASRRIHMPSLIVTVLTFILIAASALYVSSRKDRNDTGDEYEPQDTLYAPEDPADIDPEYSEETHVDDLPMEEYVEFTDQGFAPTIVWIRAEGTVTFMNSSDETLLLGSSDMLDSETFPGFEESDPIPPGGRGAVHFPEAGIWGYAHQDQPGMVGIVVVEE